MTILTEKKSKYQAESASIFNLHDLNAIYRRKLSYYVRHDFCLPAAYFPGVDAGYVKNLHPGVFWKLPYYLDEDLVSLAESFYQLVYRNLIQGKTEEILDREFSELLNTFLNFTHLYQKEIWLENIGGILASRSVRCDKIFVLVACDAVLNKRKKQEQYYSSLISEDSAEKRYFRDFQKNRFVRESEIKIPQDRFAYLLARGHQFRALRYLIKYGKEHYSKKDICHVKLDLYFNNGKYWNYINALQKCEFIPYKDTACEAIFSLHALGLQDMEEEILGEIYPDKTMLPSYLQKFRSLLLKYDPDSEDLIFIPRRERYLLSMNSLRLPDFMNLINENPDRADRMAFRFANMSQQDDVPLEIFLSLAGRNVFIRKFIAFYFDRKGDHERALLLMEGIITSDPYLRFRRGMNLIISGRHLEALGEFEWLVRKYPNNSKFWYNYGKLLADMRHNRESDHALRISAKIRSEKFKK